MDSSRKKLLISIGSVFAVVIGIAALSLPVAFWLGSMTSSRDSLDVAGPNSAPAIEGHEPSSSSVNALLTVDSQQPEALTPNYWRIPVDAPLSQMPPGDQCDEAQLSWLRDHAEPQLGALPLEASIRNSADAGAAMSLSDFRLDGDLIESAPVVIFTCAGVGGVGHQIINLYTDGAPGTWGAPELSSETSWPEGSIATVNLSPGELADLYFNLPVSDKHFSGRVLANVLGDTDPLVLVNGVEIQSKTIAGYSIRFPYNGLLQCVRPGVDPILGEVCTYAEAEALLREAAGAG